MSPAALWATLLVNSVFLWGCLLTIRAGEAKPGDYLMLALLAVIVTSSAEALL